MPDLQLSNPTGQEGLNWNTSTIIEEYLYDPTVTTATTGYANGLGLVNGMVVFLYGGYTYSTNTTSATVVSFGTGLGTSTSGAVPVIRKSPSAGSVFGQIGVVVNAPTGTTTGAGASTTVTGGYQPGQVVQVVTQGIAACLMDANNTTFAHFAVAGTTTGGAATDSATITAGKTIGVILATTTISSNTALVPVYVNLQ
jgi:hypothetical protein